MLAGGPAALAWRRQLPVWCAGAVMVGIAAVTGDHALLFPQGIAMAWGVWAALTTAIAVMAVSRTAIGPALAAGVLPAVAGVHSWTYPLAVLVTTVVVLAGRPMGNRRPQPEPAPPV